MPGLADTSSGTASITSLEDRESGGGGALRKLRSLVTGSRVPVSYRDWPESPWCIARVWHGGSESGLCAVQRTPTPLIIPSAGDPPARERPGPLGSSWVDDRRDNQIYLSHPRTLARMLVPAIIPEPEHP